MRSILFLLVLSICCPLLNWANPYYALSKHITTKALFEDSVKINRDSLRKTYIQHDKKYLLDSVQFFTHGCGMVMRKSDAQFCANYLVNNNALPELREVLDSGRMEGKFFALEAMLKGHISGFIQLTSSDFEKLKVILASRSIMHHCEGCFASHSPAWRVARKYDLNKLFSKAKKSTNELMYFPYYLSDALPYSSGSVERCKVFLSHPDSVTVFNYGLGLDNSIVPIERLYVNYLRKHQAYKQLQFVLDSGANTIGKLYAAEALLLAADQGYDVYWIVRWKRAKIRTLFNSNEEIVSFVGCVGHKMTVHEVVRKYKLSKLLRRVKRKTG